MEGRRIMIVECAEVNSVEESQGGIVGRCCKERVEECLEKARKARNVRAIFSLALTKHRPWDI
jgi:hypothetical protein